MSGNPRGSLSALLRDLRRRRGWTLKVMSQCIGIPISTLSKVEHGRLTLSYDRLQAISERLGMKLSELLCTEAPHTGGDKVIGRRSLGNTERASKISSGGQELLLLCPELRHKRITPFITRILCVPGDPVDRVLRHRSEHFAYVLTGHVEVLTEFYEPATLGPQECIYLDADMEHSYRLAPNCTQATILGVVLDVPSGFTRIGV